jgi:hypothetical protein
LGHYSIYTVEWADICLASNGLLSPGLVPTHILRRQRDIDVMTPLKRIQLKCQCGSRGVAADHL